jgi:hypothetical protein
MPADQEWRQALLDDQDKQDDGRDTLLLGFLQNKAYCKQWAKGLLALEDGILYPWEASKSTDMRQLRRRVVPQGLRRVVFSAYHSSGFAGHVGY